MHTATREKPLCHSQVHTITPCMLEIGCWCLAYWLYFLYRTSTTQESQSTIRRLISGLISCLAVQIKALVSFQHNEKLLPWINFINIIELRLRASKPYSPIEHVPEILKQRVHTFLRDYEVPPVTFADLCTHPLCMLPYHINTTHMFRYYLTK